MDALQHQLVGAPKIMRSSIASFVESHGVRNQQPMLLTAWTQTTGDDFDFLRKVDIDSSLDAENRALRDKVRDLEEKLRQHTDLLSQIHATSARIQEHTAEMSHSRPYEHITTTSPIPSTHHHEILTPPNSVICAPLPKHAEVIDYKILTSGSHDAEDPEAIEIRLAAESLNSLSSSSDSDRLEICVNDDCIIKREPSSQNDTTHMLYNIKRRKVDVIENLPNGVVNPLQQQQQNVSYKFPARKINANDHTSNTESGSDAKSVGSVMVSIGPNNTCVPASVFENINWNSSSLATRKLLVSVFDRDTLATHSMTGKPSPAFKDQHKPLKQMLDPLKIQDIIFAVTRKCSASEKEVRNAITTKCADENKMMKIQRVKHRRTIAGHELDKENLG